jgi:signal transduction histidine kinase
MSLVNLVGSLYGISLFYGITKYAQIPLPSSFAFIVLSLSMLFTRPTYGVMNIFTNNTCGGFMARRLLPSAIIIPITIGWINTYGQKLGLYRWEFGVPVLVVAMIVACCLLIATTSQALQKLDEARQSFAREREDLALQRENFMAVITHDLKNPLIGAERIFLLFLQGALGDVTPEQTKIILALKKSNDQLLAMVRNLLQLYRYDQGTQTLQFENIDLLRTLRLSMSELLSMSESHRVTIELKTPEALPLANVDSVAMGHVFSNLLQNAIKFSPEGSKVVISVNTGEDLLVFKFRDSGPGISPGEQEKLFRRFSQGHLGRANKTGTGLGLYLCCQIMRQHGGSLTLLSSELGSGSTFAMALPIAFSRLGNPRSCS